MALRRRKRRDTTTWIVVAGVAAGLAAATWLGMRIARRRGKLPPGELRRLEKSVIRTLREDSILGSRGVDVAAIAPGIVELSGVVDTMEESHHAVDVVQAIDGVRTVVNRLDLGEFTTRRQRRRNGGDLAGAQRWYGIGVGMGRRRQGRETDPARRDDKADIVSDELIPKRESDIAEAIAEESESPGRLGSEGRALD